MVEKLPVMKTVLENLDSCGICWEVFNSVRVEPKDYSIRKAIEFGKQVDAQAYLAVGGGSVMDTAKMINLFACYPHADLLDFVSFPKLSKAC